MPTTFTWIYLGNTATVLDPTEGNTTAENAALLNGTTYGSVSDPLLGRVKTATLNDVGGTVGTMDADNTVVNDTFTTDIGSVTQTFTFDIALSYNATITYVNGSTAIVTAVIVQDTAGNLYLVPELTANPDTTAYQALPIRSVTFNSVDVAGANLQTDRFVTAFRDGVVTGTDGNDLINAGYIEPTVSGNDRVDNNDAVLGGATGNDDSIRAGAGNDSVLAGLGNDSVDGGTGADVIDGGVGNDTLTGGSDASADTLFGGAGDDSLSGGDGADQLWGGADNDSIDGGTGNDTIYGGGGNDTATGGEGDDTITETIPTEAAGTITNGTFASGLTGWTVSNPTGGDAPNVVSGAVRFNTGNENNYGDSIQRTVTTTAGSSYTVSLAASEIGTGNQSHTVQIDVLDSNGNVIATLTQTIGDGGSATLSLSYTAISSTTTIRISNPLSAPANTNNSDLVVDNVVNSLTPASTGGNDSFSGGLGNDLIDGGGGNDTLTGGAGADTLTGGTENDTADYSASAAGVDVSLATGIGSGGDAAGDVLSGIENLTGSASSDSLTGDAAANVLDGGAGNDTLTGGAGNDTLTGGTGNDRFVWGITSNNDVITDFNTGNTGSITDGNQANNDFVDLSGIFTPATLAAYNAANGTSFLRPILALNHDLATNGGAVNFNGTDMSGPTLTLTGIAGLTFDQTNVTCFTAGTQIETAAGPRPVESLLPGDLVNTRDHGLQSLRWIGQRRISLADQILTPALRPVRLAAGSMGPDLPQREVMVSPQHRVLIDNPQAEMLFGEPEVLVAALHLVDDVSVTQPYLADVTYVHLLFDRHEVVQTSGLWSESFQPAARTLAGMDADQRAEIAALFPEASPKTYPAARPTLKAHEARVLLAG